MVKSKSGPKSLYVITSLARGILRVTDYTLYEGGYLLYRSQKSKFQSMAPRTAYFDNEAQAQARANLMRVRRITSLKRQLADAEAALGTSSTVTDA